MAAPAAAVADVLPAQTAATSLGRRSTSAGSDAAKRLGRVSELTGCRRSGSANHCLGVEAIAGVDIPLRGSCQEISRPSEKGQ